MTNINDLVDDLFFLDEENSLKNEVVVDDEVQEVGNYLSYLEIINRWRKFEYLLFDYIRYLLPAI